jgi:2-dehydro-3-deoxy-D-arabinonate dehydratase
VQIVRYVGPDGARVGVMDGAAVRALAVASVAELLAMPSGQMRSVVEAAVSPAAGPARLLPPVDGLTEVWACGVTYEVSRGARIEESERAADVYALIYDAERPEVFFKSVPWRVRGPGEPIGIRADSEVDVPEPELALVVNRLGEIVGYTVCNDVSSRSIEGANPLYLPQAKIYYGSCALGPWITPAWDVSDPYDLAIELRIEREGREHWQGTTTTSLLHRRLDELVGFAMRGDVHPDGLVLSTGTCLVPPTPFTLADGDTVHIMIDAIGTLTNPVRRGIPEEDA